MAKHNTPYNMEAQKTKSIENATHTVGGHKILRCVKLQNGSFSISVEDKDWAAGQVSYMLKASGKHPAKECSHYSIIPL